MRDSHVFGEECARDFVLVFGGKCEKATRNRWGDRTCGWADVMSEELTEWLGVDAGGFVYNRAGF